jgi:hypothetical protein
MKIKEDKKKSEDRRKGSKFRGRQGVTETSTEETSDVMIGGASNWTRMRH